MDENVWPLVSDVPEYKETGGNNSCSISLSAFATFCTFPVNKGCDESPYVQVKIKKVSILLCQFYISVSILSYFVNFIFGFTPHKASQKDASIVDCLLRNGPHQVSMLQVKSLELTLSKGELTILKSFDQSFRKGLLYDEIINSYLWGLCRKYLHCLFVSSSAAQNTTKEILALLVVHFSSTN